MKKTVLIHLTDDQVMTMEHNLPVFEGLKITHIAPPYGKVELNTVFIEYERVGDLVSLYFAGHLHEQTLIHIKNQKKNGESSNKNGDQNQAKLH